MKKIILILIILAGLISIYFLLKQRTNSATDNHSNLRLTEQISKENNKELLAQISKEVSGTLTINPEGSLVSWTASKISGFSHKGSLDVKSGWLNLKEGRAQIIFKVDTISSDSKSLDAHLKSEDFLNTEIYPEAQLLVSSYDNGILTGDLTIKDITQEIKVPYTLKLQEELIVLESTFNIDRTRWDINYRSGSFFENLGDNIINDLIELSVSIEAQK